MSLSHGTAAVHAAYAAHGLDVAGRRRRADRARRDRARRRIKRLVEGEPDDRRVLLGFYDWEYPLVYDAIFGSWEGEMNVTRLREFREARLWTQGELAQKAQVTQTTISRLETGRTPARVSRPFASSRRPWVSSPRPS